MNNWPSLTRFMAHDLVLFFTAIFFFWLNSQRKKIDSWPHHCHLAFVSETTIVGKSDTPKC
jgi:hypothetical protein